MTTKILAQESVQYPVTTGGQIAWNQLKADGTAISAIGTHDLLLAKLPANAIVTRGALVVTTAWAGTSIVATADVGDNDPAGADPDRYTPTALDLDNAVAVLALTASPFVTTQQCDLTMQIVIATGAATAGALTWWAEYVVIPGRAHEVIG